MKYINSKVIISTLCSWLAGFILGCWSSTSYITDSEAGLVIALYIAVATVTIYKCISNNDVVAYFDRHVGEVHTMAILDLQEAHRKHMIIVKSTHNHNMRESQNEIRCMALHFDRLNNEYDYISTMYQDQTRLNSDQEDRIHYLEGKLKEFRQLASASPAAPFSAPASQTSFEIPPRPTHIATATPSPLSQEPMSQVPEVEEAQSSLLAQSSQTGPL